MAWDGSIFKGLFKTGDGFVVIFLQKMAHPHGVEQVRALVVDGQSLSADFHGPVILAQILETGPHVGTDVGQVQPDRFSVHGGFKFL
jgi:hypothetical protein